MAALPGRDALRSVLAVVAWVVSATVIGAGGAGIVTGADHLPGDASRPELTSKADARMRSAVLPIAEELRALQQDVAQLGQRGREALGDLAARDVATLKATLDGGDVLVGAIEARKSVIRAGLFALPYSAASERIGERVRTQVRAIEGALDAVDVIAADWAQLARGVVPATRLRELLERHDQQTLAAAESATRDNYARAVVELQVSLDLVRQAEEIRKGLATTADVSTLGVWLDRNRRYDLALAALYRELDASNGRVTAKARAAFAEVRRLQELLPADTRALVVVMSDIAQGGLNQAVLAIEQARGRLADAVTAVD